MQNEFYLDTLRQFLSIDLLYEQNINSDGRLEIDFAGDMKNRLVGLYTSSYLSEDGKIR